MFPVSNVASTRWQNSQWATEQTLKFVRQTKSCANSPTILIHNHDAKFDSAFKQTLNNNGIKRPKLPVRSPNLNARVERFIQTIKHECLDKFIAFGHDHLHYLVREFVEHSQPKSCTQ